MFLFFWQKQNTEYRNISQNIHVFPSVRLVGGRNNYEGRVEILYNDEWGTICDDNWDQDDAQVVCRSLGLSGRTPVLNAGFGHGSGPIWLDEVACGGLERSLMRCRHGGWGNNNCFHGEDAGVRCSP